MRARRPSPPGRSNSSRSQRPYLTVMQCHPAATNMSRMRPAAMSGTTRSSDCRLRSTIHITSPRRATIGSTRASQIAPSSISASPMRAIWRPPRGIGKWPAVYRCASAAQRVAVAPIPTEPVEKSTGSGSFTRLG